MPSSQPSRPRGFIGQFRTDTAARSAYSQGAGPYRIVPTAVAVPRETRDLLTLMQWSRERDLPVIPRGAGSGMPGGNVGRGLIVDLRAFDRPLFVSANRTANVGAAIVWRDINEAAAHFNARLPPDPSSGAFCTIGGMVSTNAAGARSVRFGSIRRWVRGVELVTADGEVGWIGRADHPRPSRKPRSTGDLLLGAELPAIGRFARDVAPSIHAATATITQRFPRTTKNSAGYALDAFVETGDVLDLIIGSEGTLGFVTRVELDLDVQPAATASVLLALSDTADLADVVRYLLDLEPAACEFLDRTFLEFADVGVPTEGVDGLLLLEFERPSASAARGAAGDAVRGTDAWCRYAETALTAEDARRLWQVRHAASPVLASLPAHRQSLQVIEDGCVPVEHLETYLRGVREIGARCGVEVVIFGHAGDGHLHVNALVDPFAAGVEDRLNDLLQGVTDLVVSLGGTPSGEHGDGRLRGPILPRVYGPEIVDLFRRVKHAFDPAGLCNPGVIVTDPDARSIADLKAGDRAAAIPAPIASRLDEIERAAQWGVSKLSLAPTADPTAPSSEGPQA